MKRLVIFILAISMPFSALAISPGGDFRCLAKEADNVVVVRDGKTEKFIMRDYFGPLFLTQLEIKKQFKGVMVVAREPVRNFDIIVRRDDIHSAGFRLAQGTRSLVFIRNTDQGPALLGGSSGVLPYNDGISLYGVELDDAAIRTFFGEENLAKVKCAYLGDAGSVVP
ncbi:hypothetical protein [Xanthomonas sp. 3307]|uniref:hypothetical protein n=1 Tax=Xanthomonas sp. 3307 TaxID=3035316 RepID=UPI00161935AA|nr:hypothetical protein [Xanthomonas sp. 3307]MBB5940545.1 hypothetical protein [Xanthomonas sp. 3307]